ncbi:MAG TPA: alpha/beta hydrolase [Aggregatilineales bacterium]|nr:alpha/beta hydrolase [Aggregatilineales bacterium]
MFKRLLSLAATCALAVMTIPSLAVSAADKVALTDCTLPIGTGSVTQPVAAKCGVLPVPEFRDKPGGRQLDIHFTILPAEAPDGTSKPLFHLEGGPGGAAISDFGKVWYGAYTLLRKTHDIVLIDQRGTGTSASLQCPEVANMALSDLAKDLTDAESQKLYEDRLSTCLKRVAAKTDPAAYISDALADDTDAIRAALGYDQIDLFGNSYGTWLGQYYLRRHGEHVHALVLDSVTGPWNLPFIDFPNNAQASLDKVFALCKDDPACDARYPDLPGKLQTVLTTLAKKSRSVYAPSLGSGRYYSVTMTRSRFLDALGQALYQASIIGLIPQMIDQAANDDYTFAAGLELAVAEQANSISIGMYSSVACAESVAFYTDAILKAHQRGTVFSSPDTSRQDCQHWRSAELSAADVAPITSERPVLILSGAFDPITPVAFAQETHDRLNHSTLVVLPYQGHGVIIGSACAQNIVARFLADPSRPVDSSCASSDLKPLFAGVYKETLIPYTDAEGTFTSRVPKDWPLDAAASGGNLKFFVSADAYQQILGVGVFKNTSFDDVQKKALDLVTRAFGQVSFQTQLTISLLVVNVRVVGVNLTRPDQAYGGLLTLRSVGGDTVVVWQAAPYNAFQTSSLVITPVVVNATNPQ